MGFLLQTKDKANTDSNERGFIATGNSDQKVKSSRKRKDEDDYDNEEQENCHDNENSSSHKKARVVWTVELHHKFVAAVNQLGFESMFFNLSVTPHSVITFLRINYSLLFRNSHNTFAFGFHY